MVLATTKCRKCGRLLPEDDFYERDRQKRGQTGFCKRCRRAYGREYYRRNRERCRELQRRWRKKIRRKGQTDKRVAAAIAKRARATSPEFTERERETLCLRLGLNQGKAKSLQEIADDFGISRQRVLQLEQRGIRKLEALISELRGREERRRGMLKREGRKTMVVLWPDQLDRLQRQTNGMQRKFSSTVRHVLDIGFAIQDLYSGKEFPPLSLE